MTLADTKAIAFMLGRPEATIRSWAHRGLSTGPATPPDRLKRRGTGPRQTALYDVGEVLKFATRHGLLDSPATSRNNQMPAGPVRPHAGALPISRGDHGGTQTVARHHHPARLRA